MTTHNGPISPNHQIKDSLFEEFANISRVGAYLATGNPAFLKSNELWSDCCAALARDVFEEMNLCPECHDHCTYVPSGEVE